MIYSFNERLQFSNAELVQWCESQEFTPQKTWRYCELLAAGDLSLTYGTYIEPIVRPMIARG